MKVLISISDIFNISEARGKLSAALNGDTSKDFFKQTVQEVYDILEKIRPLDDPNCQMFLDSGRPVADE